jgi:hypothetical protein
VEEDTESEVDPTAPLVEQQQAAQISASQKTPVLDYLFRKLETSNSKIVSHADLFEAIDYANAAIEEENAARLAAGLKRRKKLSKSNPANFLKDIIRTPKGNDWWPVSAKGWTARQRYRDKLVMQFVPTPHAIPFPDHFLPGDLTKTHDIEAASIPYLARMLGRKEETWLTQIVVNLRLVETQMGVHSPDSHRLRDITHLQVGMKTQPEIDATYVMTLRDTKDGEDWNVFITCEAKQLGERLLEDQIRTQVARAMDETARFSAPKIHAVKPIFIQVLERDGERFIYIVEFEEFERGTFNNTWRNEKPPNDERLYDMPLKRASDALYRLCPPIPGINA